MPDPEDVEDIPLGQDWREYLAAVQYEREEVSVTREERVGESERDLTGTGFVTITSYEEQGKDAGTTTLVRRESIPVDQRQREICDQLFDLTVEVLFDSGLPMTARPIIYKVLLSHVSEKFLAGKTVGQCAQESQLLTLQDTLHQIRRVFSRRELLKAIIGDPPRE